MITTNAGIKNIYFNNQLIKKYFSLKPIKFYRRCREMFGVRLMDKNRMNFFDFKSLTKYHNLE